MSLRLFATAGLACTPMLIPHSKTRLRQCIERHARRATTQRRAAIGVFAAAAVLAIGAREVPRMIRARIDLELDSMGLQGAEVHLASIGWSHIRLDDLHLGPDLEAASVDLAYGDPIELLAGRIRTVTVHGARWTTTLDRESLSESTPVRLLAASGSGEVRAVPPAIVLEDGHVTLVRVGADPIELDARGEIVPGDLQGAFVVSSDLGEHEVLFHATERESGDTSLALTATKIGASLGALELTADLASDAIGFVARAEVPSVVLDALTPDLAMDAGAHVRASGTARAVEGGYELEDAHAVVEAAHAAVASADFSLEDARAELSVRGSIGERIALALDPTSTVHARVVTLADARLEEATLEGAVSLATDTGAPRITVTGPLTLRARAFVLGSERSELRFHDADVAFEADDESPLFEQLSESARGSVRLAGTAASVSGVLRGRDVRVRGRLDAAGDARGSTVSLPIDVRVARVAQRDAETTLARAHFTLPLEWDTDGELHVAGSMRAHRMAWRAVGLGPVRGSVRIGGERVRLDWTGDATRDARFRMRASIALSRGATHLHVDVPAATIAEGDALHEVLETAAGVGVEGRIAGATVHVDPRVPGLGTASMTLAGATVTNPRARSTAHGVEGTVRLRSLDPALSVDEDALAFRELRIGDLVHTRRGSARLRFEREGVIRVADAVARFGGGRVRVQTFRYVPGDPDVVLHLAVDGIEIQQAVAELAPGRAVASGVVDGTLSLRLHMDDEESRLVLGEGRLAARGPGRLRLPGSPSRSSTPTDLAAVSDGAWIRDRVLAALADFDYSELVFDLVKENGVSHLHARLAGQGRETPQGVSLHVDVGDIQALVDQSMRLWPARPRARQSKRSS